MNRSLRALLLGLGVLLVPLPLTVRAVVLPLPPPPAGPYRVLVVDWGLHTAIVVQQPPGWRLGPPGAEAAPFLEVAWGDRRYYAEGQRRLDVLAAALLLPTESVLFLAPHPDPPRLQGAWRVLERQVDAPTLHRLLSGLESSLHRGTDGRRPQPLAPPQRPSLASPAHFFPARGSYLWHRNCNWWIVRHLGDAGLARPALGVLLPLQVPWRLIGFEPLR
jgi:hypothetical protein